MSSSFDISVNQSDVLKIIDSLVDNIDEDSRLVMKANQIATRKLASWMRTQGKAGYAQGLQAKRADVKTRTSGKLHKVPGTSSAYLNIFQNPIAAKRLKAKQTGGGVKVSAKSEVYERAFYSNGKSRNGSRMPKGFFFRVGKGRLPIKILKVDVREETAHIATSKITPKLQKRYMIEFEKALSDLMNKKRG